MPDQEHRSVTPSWLTSPLLLTLVGLIGTGTGAVLQGFWNTRLEREKFEFSLIAKALAVPNKDEAAQNLKFLVDAGLINQFNSEKIAKLAANPKTLPDFLGLSGLIPVRQGKMILSRVGTYQGAIDDEWNDAYRKAIIDFQASQNMNADGLIGPQTFDRMKTEYTKATGIWPPAETPKSKP
ncbi:peptidoglycan-binding protein [Bradyrhizobium hipponense]|uniref:Peptidoglycan-binding protein n=1 Tax=Bradyrhizobium hipponense TaxID=2605638 RepID=A0A5S4YK44_9BRAD|nr:peptidoglycan-binding domain-containing protein [Bradyrhizobium hipponense]TYO63984.1 peptidoglycan-binding protein [Bradyrhizobium hipponense]